MALRHGLGLIVRHFLERYALRVAVGLTLALLLSWSSRANAACSTSYSVLFDLCGSQMEAYAAIKAAADAQGAIDYADGKGCVRENLASREYRGKSASGTSNCATINFDGYRSRNWPADAPSCSSEEDFQYDWFDDDRSDDEAPVYCYEGCIYVGVSDCPQGKCWSNNGSACVVGEYEDPADHTGLADRDDDGVPNDQDAFPDDPLEWTDTDGDGVGDNADNDDDGDGVPDVDDPDSGSGGNPRDYSGILEAIKAAVDRVNVSENSTRSTLAGRIDATKSSVDAVKSSVDTLNTRAVELRNHLNNISSYTNTTAQNVASANANLGGKLDAIKSAVEGIEGGEGSEGDDDDNTAVGGDCASAYQCAGDPHACAILAEQHATRCNGEALVAELVSEADAGDGIQGDELDGFVQRGMPGDYVLESGLIDFGSSCPVFPTLEVNGMTWTPPAELCDVLAAIRWLVIAAAYIWALRVIFGG